MGYLGTSAFKLCDSADILLTQVNNRIDTRIADSLLFKQESCVFICEA